MAGRSPEARKALRPAGSRACLCRSARSSAARLRVAQDALPHRSGGRAGAAPWRMVAFRCRGLACARLLSGPGRERGAVLALPRCAGGRGRAVVAAWARRSMRYAELQVTTHYSFLRGASSPEELFASAALLGIEAMAVVDRNSLAGLVRAHEAAKATGTRLIVGCRLDLTDGPSLLIYPI